MSRIVIVVPSIVPEFTQACLRTLHPSIVAPDALPVPPTRQFDTEIRIVNGTQWHEGQPDVRLAVVWNTPSHNLGVAGSWNVGVEETLRTKADWLVILSAGVRFGPSGARDFLGVLDSGASLPASANVFPNNVKAMEADDGLGWHLLAFHRSVLQTVGLFDPVFHPAYSEDLDYSRRIQLAYGVDSTTPDFVGPLWPKVQTDATLTGVAHGIKQGGVTVDFVEIERRYVAKWGAPSPSEHYPTPYNDPSLDWTHTGGPLVTA